VKRASLPLFLVLLAASGLASWLFVAERPGMLRAGESTAVDLGRIALEPAPVGGRGSAPELAPESEPGSVRMQAEEPERRSSGLGGAGHISGWVWRLVGKVQQGIPDGPVQLWLATGDRPLASDAKPIGETATRTMGSFRFPEVPQGSYFVSVECEGCARHLTRVELAAGGASKVLEFVLGHSRVEGLVSALEGDARPTLELEPRRRSRLEVCWPDEQGRFAFEDLPQGDYELRVRWHTQAPGGWREDITRFKLGDGARLSFRVGSAVPLARWRGRVSIASEPPREDAVLRFDPHAAASEWSEEPTPERFEIDEAGRFCMLSDSRLRVRVGIDARGAFDVALPRTLWWTRLEVDALSQRTCALGSGSLAGGDLVLDLICPGSRVRGRVSSKRRAAPGTARQIVYARGNGSSCYAGVDARGRFALDGLEEGTWYLSVAQSEEPQPEPVEVRIGPVAAVLERDL